MIGFQPFSSGVGNANTTYYTIAGQGTSEWEVGIGTYTSAGNTLSRDTVLSSSNGGALVNFSAGQKDIWVDYAANKAVTTDTLAYPPAIGGTTPAAGTFTTLTATGQTSLGGAAGSEGLRVVSTASAVNWTQISGAASGGTPYIGSQGAGTNINMDVFSKGTGSIRLNTLSGGVTQALVSHTASAVNYVQVTGAATSSAPVLSVQGSDSSIALGFQSKGTGGINFFNQGGATSRQFRIDGTTTAVNYLQAAGSVTGNGVQFSAQGSDTNISQVFQSKGTGAIDLAAGSSGVNISNGGTVTAITRTAAGSGYTSIPSITISAPTTAGGVQATVTGTQFGATTATIQSGGTGYTVNDVITLVGGTLGGASAATYTVTAVSGGVITAVSPLNFAAYTALPTNPVSVTGGTGSGATLNVTYYFATTSISNAGSGYVEQPTVSFSGGGGSGAAAFATIGTNSKLTTSGNYFSIYSSNSGSESIRIYGNDSGNSQYQQATGPGLVFIPPQNQYGAARIGTQQNFHALELGTAFNTAGSVGISFRTGGVYGPPSGGITSGATQLAVSHTASAVNYVQVTGAATGSGPTISAQGSDTNVALNIASKAAQNINFRTGASSLAQFTVVHNGATIVNQSTASGSATGFAPIFGVQGSDTNISQVFQSKGTGAIDLSAGSSGVNISNGGTVTAITRTATGSAYTSIPSVAITAPTTAGGVQATATATMFAASATIQSGGTGYTLNDVLTVSGGTFVGAASFTVTGVTGGVVTAVTLASGGSGYSVLPTNPVSTTGGTGTGCTLNITSWGLSTTFTITNAGSGYVEQPTVTFSGGGGSGAAAYAQVGSSTPLKSLANSLDIYTASGLSFKVSDGGGQAAANYWQAIGAAGAPDFRSTASGTISSSGANALTFRTNSTTSQFVVSHTASAVNYVQVTGAATGSGPTISAQGSDTNIDLTLTPKGTGQVKATNATNMIVVSNGQSGFGSFLAQSSTGSAYLFGYSGGSEVGRVYFSSGSTGIATGSPSTTQFVVSHTASAVNYVQVTGAATSSDPTISAQGSDASINFTYLTKGSAGEHRFSTNTGGNIQFKITHTASAANYFAASGSATGFAPTLKSTGSDTNISQVFQSKGTGAIDLAAGSSGVNISNGGTVTAITRTATGSGYTSFPTGSISAPTTAGGVQATFSFTLFNLAATIQAGGSGYTVGDVLTVTGGTTAEPAMQFTVSTVSAGAVTAVTATRFASYSVLPTNPASVTGGTGTGCTLNITYGLSTTSLTITNAGSGYVEQPTVTFSGGGGSGAAAYATVGSAVILKTLHRQMSVYTAGGESTRITDLGGLNDSFVTLSGSQYQRAYVGADGSATNIGLQIGGTKGTGSIFLTTGTSGTEQLRVSHTASAVNYVQVTGAATGGRPAISAQGSDSAINMQYDSKSTGYHVFRTNGVFQFVVLNTTGAVNYTRATGSLTGVAPAFSVEGSDTNIDLALTPKGTGYVQFGTYTANMALTVQGYIEVKDSSGTVRKLAVIA